MAHGRYVTQVSMLLRVDRDESSVAGVCSTRSAEDPGRRIWWRMLHPSPAHPRRPVPQLARRRGCPPLLEARPDLATPAPHDSSQLAARVVVKASVLRALDGLDALELTALQALVQGTDPADLPAEARRPWPRLSDPPRAGSALVWGSPPRPVLVVGDLLRLPAGPFPTRGGRPARGAGLWRWPGRSWTTSTRTASTAGGAAVPARRPTSSRPGCSSALDERHVTVPWSGQAGPAEARAVLLLDEPPGPRHLRARPVAGRPGGGRRGPRARAAGGAPARAVGHHPPAALRPAGWGCASCGRRPSLLQSMSAGPRWHRDGRRRRAARVGTTGEGDVAWLPTDAFDAWEPRPAGTAGTGSRAPGWPAPDGRAVGGRVGRQAGQRARARARARLAAGARPTRSPRWRPARPASARRRDRRRLGRRADGLATPAPTGDAGPGRPLRAGGGAARGHRAGRVPTSAASWSRANARHQARSTTSSRAGRPRAGPGRPDRGRPGTAGAGARPAPARWRRRGVARRRHGLPVRRVLDPACVRLRVVGRRGARVRRGDLADPGAAGADVPRRRRLPAFRHRPGGAAESFLRSDDETALTELVHQPGPGTRLRRIAPTW